MEERVRLRVKDIIKHHKPLKILPEVFEKIQAVFEREEISLKKKPHKRRNRVASIQKSQISFHD
jgi:hypothetical protein